MKEKFKDQLEAVVRPQPPAFYLRTVPDCPQSESAIAVTC